MIIVGEASSKEVALGFRELEPRGHADVLGGRKVCDEAFWPPLLTCTPALLLQEQNVLLGCSSKQAWEAGRRKAASREL